MSERNPLTLEELRKTPHGKIKDETLRHVCNRANGIVCEMENGVNQNDRKGTAAV